MMKTEYIRTGHVIREAKSGSIVFQGNTKLARITNRKGEVVQEAPNDHVYQ